MLNMLCLRSGLSQDVIQIHEHKFVQPQVLEPEGELKIANGCVKSSFPLISFSDFD